MNARTDQSNDDVSFIRTKFLLDRNVVLRFCCGAKQPRCQRGFPLCPAHFPRVLRGRKLEDCPEINIGCQAPGEEFRCRTEPSSLQDSNNGENIPSCVAPG